ncbi:MAG: WYL domain-containing protein [Firmicutes bacterium]|nr:WYL domain-containing protein [Bacillota bacterium]
MDNDSKLRPLYLAKILYEQTDEEHYLTTSQLIQILDDTYGVKAHRQTIKSEIELLRRFGFEIEEVKSTQNRYNLFGRKFDVPELKLLIDAVESSKFITAGKSKELVDKLSSLGGIYVESELKRNVSCESRIKLGNERIYIIIDAINEAINQNKKIAFQYFQYNANKEKVLKRNGEEYVFTPLHLVWNGDCYYMIGVYDDRSHIASFRVDRIAKRPVILEEQGTAMPEDFDVDEYINTTFRMFNSDHRNVELICDNDVMDSIIDRFGEDVSVFTRDESTFRIIVNVAVSHIFFSWIFGFGGKVKIVSPQEVKDMYREMISKAAGSI